MRKEFIELPKEDFEIDDLEQDFEMIEAAELYFKEEMIGEPLTQDAVIYGLAEFATHQMNKIKDDENE